MSPTDHAYAVDYRGLPVRDPFTGGTSIDYATTRNIEAAAA